MSIRSRARVHRSIGLTMTFLGCLCPNWLAAQPTTGATKAAAGKPMNVVLILADDLGWSDIASHGATCTRRLTWTGSPAKGFASRPPTRRRCARPHGPAS